MIDTLVRMESAVAGSTVLQELGVEPGGYILVTLHRPALVDGPGFDRVLASLARLATWTPVVFPVHPRTRARVGGAVDQPGLRLIAPVGYVDFLALETHARGRHRLRRSQEETTHLEGAVFHDARANTERPVTVSRGRTASSAPIPTRSTPCRQRSRRLVAARRTAPRAGTETPPGASPRSCSPRSGRQSSRRVSTERR